MSRALRASIAGAALVCLLGTAPACWAEDQEVAVEAPAAKPIVQSPFGNKAIEIGALAKQRGGTDPGPLSEMKLNGVVSDNRASNLTTGNNVISDGAFAGINGVPLVVQNSGNNVLIQSATIINVQIK